jgi:hypothetical protein
VRYPLRRRFTSVPGPSIGLTGGLPAILNFHGRVAEVRGESSGEPTSQPEPARPVRFVLETCIGLLPTSETGVLGGRANRVSRTSFDPRRRDPEDSAALIFGAARSSRPPLTSPPVLSAFLLRGGICIGTAASVQQECSFARPACPSSEPKCAAPTSYSLCTRPPL